MDGDDVMNDAAQQWGERKQKKAVNKRNRKAEQGTANESKQDQRSQEDNGKT